MKINFKKNNSNKETTLGNGDVVIVKSNFNSSIFTLLYFVDTGGSGEDLLKLLDLDDLTTMEINSELVVEFDGDEYEIVKHFAEEELDCKILEVIPSNQIEIKRI